MYSSNNQSASSLRSVLSSLRKNVSRSKAYILFTT